MITLLSRFDAKDPASAEGMKTLLLELSDKVRSEPGHLSYQVFSTADETDTLWVTESWATQADADRHGKLVATNGAVDRAVPLLSGPIVTMTLLSL